MKTIRTISIITVFAAVTSLAAAQNFPDEYLGLPGDNLNLYAVMNLFQESETLEAFERSLNDQESTINNLDLNGDNFVDYITVSDFIDDNVHTIVLRTSLERDEQQDIAVFMVEKLRNDAVQIQLIGDEALYGSNYIVEPIYAETSNPGYTGRTNSRNANVLSTTYYEIAAWPVVRYIYHPRYSLWRSSWYWGYYPSYWHAWTPHYWHYYYGYHSHWHNHYYSHYRHWNNYRSRSYNTFYNNRVRVYSPTVALNINKKHYRNTYSRPDQRRAGEQRYAQNTSQRARASRTSVSTQRSGSRSGTVSQRQGVQRSTNAVRSSTTRSSSQRTTPSVQNRSSQSRSNKRSTPAVSRNSSQRSTPAVQNRSSQSRSTKRSAPAVSRSSSQRSTPSVQNRSSQSRSTKRSAPAVSRSSSKRSKPAVSKRSSSRSSGKKSSSRTSKSRSSSTSRR